MSGIRTPYYGGVVKTPPRTPFGGKDWFKGFLDFLKAQDWLQERYPGPKEPEFPSYQGLTAEQESGILDALRERIGKQTSGQLRSARTEMASRGSYRSGLLPALETKIRRGGAERETSALSEYYLGKAGRMQQFNLAGAQFNLQKWLPLLQAYQESMAGAGQTFGRFYRR